MKFDINKFVPGAVTRTVARKALIVQKNSPTLLFGAGIVGVVATAVLASRATLKLEEVLEPAQENLETARTLHAENHMDYSDSDYRQDVVLIRARAAMSIAKLYALPVAVGIASIGCLASSHHILNQRNLALTAAYATLDKGFREYRDRVAEELGIDKERELRFKGQTETQTVEDENGKKIKETVTVATETSIYAKFFDRDNQNWDRKPEYNFLFLRAQQAYANDILQIKGHIFLNEVYDMLGLERTPAGQVVGWLRGEGDDFVDFGIFGGDNPQGIYNFVTGADGAVLLDFNVDGVIYDKI